MKKTIKILASILALLSLIYWVFVLIYRTSTSDDYTYGVSFSQKYAEELGLEWDETYLALIDDLGIKKLRLMSYWDLHESTQDQYDFSNLDWQIEQAELRGIDVVLVVGARQPRYPECHLPEWVKDLGDQQFEEELFNYVSTVVARYNKSSAIEAWQLENEPRNVVFSTCRPFYDADRLQAEFDLIRKNDQERDIYMTLSTEFQLPVSGPIGDKVGYSIYEEVNAEVLGKRVQWEHVVPASWHSFRSGLIKVVKNRDTYIHELQAEPWGHTATANMTQEEMDRSMNPERFVKNVEYAQKTGNDLFYLWGGEWWYWQKTVNNNPAMWDAAYNELNS